jgi:hypothetical protein
LCIFSKNKSNRRTRIFELCCLKEGFSEVIFLFDSDIKMDFLPLRTKEHWQNNDRKVFFRDIKKID